MQQNSWTYCIECFGRGKKSLRLKKKVRLQYQQELALYEKSDKQSNPPSRPKAHLIVCSTCAGSGLVTSIAPPIPDTINYPHIAIIGAGIGGVALAVACLHRGIPFTIFEKDENFESRSQGYGLTLQQASVAMKGFGIHTLKDGIISTRHIVHTPEGKIIGVWGVRKWMQNELPKSARRTNMHIARQLLRAALLEQLGGSKKVSWGHQFNGFQTDGDNRLTLNFIVSGNNKQVKANLIVGADGIRSAVRKQIIGEDITPLHYLNCIVILGICPLKNLNNVTSDLLDGATVFQTANGNERIYIMPFTADSVMWQLSFPLDEKEAIKLSSLGKQALKEEARRRTLWHSPIPEIINATSEQLISGYPVYDRELLNSTHLENIGAITLLGDAAHPMSPFKGQGANQALLDALSLARLIAHGCNSKSNWKEKGIRAAVLNDYEKEMLTRSAAKVQDSNQAAEFLHSELVLLEADEPRGRILKRKQ